MVEIEKPTWTSRVKAPIYSVDIHPDGTRFATCQEKKIYVWRMSGLSSPPAPSSKQTLDSNIEMNVASNPTQNQVVCTLEYHQNPINCVKFSPNGKLLAACSDDFTVTVYHCQNLVDLKQVPATSTPTTGFSKNVEDWNFFKLFRKHNKDVLGVAWSNDSKFLASCSVDNTVVVYDILIQDSCKTLDGHHDIVKGLAFDPINKYLATQSDKLLIIWSTALWEQKYVIEDPFSKSIGNTMFFRPSWSPDGSLLITGNGIKDKKHTAPIFMRNKQFENEQEYKGHKDVVVVAKYNPVAFENPKDPNNVVFYTAVGSLDKSLSIWASNMGYPVTVIQDLFEQGVVDLSWSHDGYELICCSSDGTIAYIRFSEATLGKSISKEKFRMLMREQYGEVSGMNSLLEAPPSASYVSMDTSSDDTPQTVYIQQAPVQTIVTEQKESRTKEGKRRIQPRTVSTIPTVQASSVVSQQFAPVFDLNAEPVAQPTEVLNKLIDARADGGVTHTSFSQLQSPLQPAPSVPVVRRVEANINVDRITVSQPTSTQTPAPVLEIDIQPIYLRIDENEEFKCTAEGDVEYLVRGQKAWGGHVWGGPIMAAATSSFVAVCCAPNNLHIFLRSGRRPFAPILLDGVATNVACQGNYLLALTSSKTLHLWDIAQQKSLLRTSINALLADANTSAKVVDDIGVTEKGVPVVTLSSGESYVWDSPMECFVCIADSHASASPFITTPSHLYGYGKRGDEEPLNLGYLRAKASRSHNKPTNAVPRGTTTIEELEIAMAAAASLGDTRDYRKYSRAYTQQLVLTTNETRLREWCAWLLGPIRSKQEEKIAGVSRREVLQGVINIVKNGSGVALQRIVGEFEEALQEARKKL